MCYFCKLGAGKSLRIKLIPELLIARKDETEKTTNNDIKMNEVATRIWEIIDKPIKINEIINILTSEYDVEFSECTDTVLNFLSELNHIGLISICG